MTSRPATTMPAPPRPRSVPPAPPVPVGRPGESPHDAVLRDLGRPIPGAPGLGVIGTLLIAVPTLGLLPAFIWPLRWAAFASAERRQFNALAEWARLNARHPATPRLTRRVNDLWSRALLSALGLACCVAVLAMFVAMFVPLGPDAPLDCTYRFLPGLDGLLSSKSADPSADLRRLVFLAWSALLTVAYLSHWLQVQLHARRVRRVLDEFNTIALEEGLPPVFLQPIGMGLRPLWVLGAILLIANSAPWGVAMMLAGAVQRRYTRHASPTARRLLWTRVGELIAYRRSAAGMAAAMPPALPRPPVPPPRMRCATAGCRLPLPAGARFCPRCGAQSAPPLDRVA